MRKTEPRRNTILHHNHTYVTYQCQRRDLCEPQGVYERRSVGYGGFGPAVWLRFLRQDAQRTYALPMTAGKGGRLG